MEPQELRRRIITELSRTAGPRGFTYLGRTAQPGESPEEILQRIPTGELETGSLAAQAPELLKAAIPLGMWKAMSVEGKTMLTQLANKFPLLFERALKEKRFLTADVGEILPGRPYGRIEPISPMTKRLKVDPGAVQSDTPLHELTHFVQNTRVAKTNPDDAEQIGILLYELLGQEALKQRRIPQFGSLQNSLNDLVNIKAEMKARGLSPRQLPLGEDTVHSRSLHKYDTTTMLGNRQRLMMDEGLAYLATEASRKEAPSIIKILAARLGVLPE